MFRPIFKVPLSISIIFNYSYNQNNTVLMVDSIDQSLQILTVFLFLASPFIWYRLIPVLPFLIFHVLFDKQRIIHHFDHQFVKHHFVFEVRKENCQSLNQSLV